MDSFELFLLGGSYQTVEDGVVLELFGRSRTGEAVVARYYGFRPYFDLVEPKASDLERLNADPEVLGVEPGTTWIDGKERARIRVTIRFPFRVPEYRDRYRRPGEEHSVLACDIPFFHRFLYDKGLGLTVQFDAESEPPEVASRYGAARVVRVSVTPGRDIRPSEPFRPPLTVLAFDIENAIKGRTIFTICGVTHRSDGQRSTFRLRGPDEAAMLRSFAEAVRSEDADVVTGYNIGGYDIPLVLERAKALGVEELPFGRDNGPFREAGERLWRLSGRVVADAWWAVRRDLRPKQESLQFVSRTFLGDQKLDVDQRNIEAEWAKDPDRVVEYCEHDADLALRILEKLRTVDKAADLATVAHLPLEEGLNGRTSQFIDAMLIPRADRLGIGVPMNHHLRRENPIEGGYVHTIKPGIYRWVVVLDFKSMYPSIIIQRNICFTTLSDEGTTVSPSGAKFLSSDVRAGVVPAILRELLADRDRLRRKMTEAATEAERQYYDGLQNAVKILMNSFYGVLASSFYRFTDKSIGAAITSFAREAITSIIRSLEADGHQVVYSDTDSVFVLSPEGSLSGARAFGEQVSKRFTEAGVQFEFQTVYESLFSHGAKKRYVGRTAWPKEELVVRGYETRRTDAFDYQSESLLEVFELLLGSDTPAAVERARELVRRLKRGDVPMEKLVIARSVRAEEEYNESTRDGLPFLRVFKRLKEEGYDVIPGMKVAWIVTDANKSPQAVEPWIEGRPFPDGKGPDYAYYADRLAQTLARVTEVFGWDADRLLDAGRQHTLPGSSAGSDSPPDAATLETPVASVGTSRRRGTQTQL
ncbi:MAG: DNA polymerase II [Thermoplasmata archaeon]|nr:DNA polymerase II [Thermoplasmata archaeon]MCI4359225.1 DNA polymerase II [Thermoplasmata archaeon]